ncbi:hypothetical protein B0E51_05490 [Rhodanobacter sp. C05]|nr:hypothetical protein B0E51_05490 [Rhodanobacter sp. C05]
MIIAIFFIVVIVSAANATGLHWKVIDGKGKLLGDISGDFSGDFSGVRYLQKSLQSTYPGIALSIRNCKQPTLVQSTDAVYGRDWQCGSIIYNGSVIRPKSEVPVIRFQPSSSHWHFVGQDGGNDIIFINDPNPSGGHIFIWTEDYSAFALADAISMREGKSVYATGLEDSEVPAEIRKVANDIVDANPSEIGGTTYHTSGLAQKMLFEIDCASGRMRNVQSLGTHGEIFDFLRNSASPWYKPTFPNGRLTLMQRECGH